jgi:phage tail-like protein
MTDIPYRQIPWVGIDALRAWQAGDLALVNTEPADGSTGKPRGGPVVFDLMCTVTGRNVDTSTIDVWVKSYAGGSWEQAIDNGVWQGSWGGGLSGTVDGNDRVTIYPPADFGSEAVVGVHVVADVDGGGGFPIDVTYSYSVEDYEAPQLVSALGWQPKKVRATFNEDMGASAEVAANWSLSAYHADRRAVVLPAASSVVAISSTVFELEFEYELSPGAEYTLTAGPTVLDDSGNAIDTAHDSVQFTAYDFRDLTRLKDGWQVYQMLSEYDRRRDQLGDLERVCSLIQYPIDIGLHEIDKLKDLSNPDWCDADYLNHLLFDVGNPLPFVTDEQAKRRICWRARELNNKRGTAPGIELAVLIVTGLSCNLVKDRSHRWRLGIRTSNVEAAADAIYVAYEAHRVLTAGGVHGAPDTTNVVASSLYPASGQSGSAALINAVLAAFESHRILTAGGVHGAADTTNAVYRTASSDWSSAANLCAELRRKYEAHRLLTAGAVHGSEDTVNEDDVRPGDSLNFDTRLGGGAAMPYSFWLKFNQALTAVQEAEIALCAEAMKCERSHYLGALTP